VAAKLPMISPAPTGCGLELGGIRRVFLPHDRIRGPRGERPLAKTMRRHGLASRSSISTWAGRCSVRCAWDSRHPRGTGRRAEDRFDHEGPPARSSRVKAVEPDDVVFVSPFSAVEQNTGVIHPAHAGRLRRMGGGGGSAPRRYADERERTAGRRPPTYLLRVAAVARRSRDLLFAEEAYDATILAALRHHRREGCARCRNRRGTWGGYRRESRCTTYRGIT
jgi:hypothetical protein